MLELRGSIWTVQDRAVTIRICRIWRELSAHTADPYRHAMNASLMSLDATYFGNEPRFHHIAGILEVECEG